MKQQILAKSLLVVLAIALAASPRPANAVSDNFSDLNDTVNPTWTHLTGYVNSTGQTWDASTGQYRMTAQNNGLQALGFVGSHVGPSFTNVVVKADLVNFIGPPVGPVIGVGARLNGLNGTGQLTGYAYLYEPFANGGGGEMVMNRINPGVNLTDLGAIGTEGVDYIRKVTLDPNKDYTFSLAAIGSNLRGEVREVGGPLVAFQNNMDAGFASGTSGLLNYSQNPAPPVDVTWDNFSAVVPEPAGAVLVAIGVATMLLGRRRNPAP
jgi:hypothetical protein